MPFLLSASLGFMCGIVGSLFGGYECEMVGRKACLIIQSTLTFCGLLLMSFAPSFLVLLIGRAIHGYSTGALTGAVPIYISELCQPQIRSFTGTLNLSVYAMSTGAVFVIGAKLSISPLCARALRRVCKFFCRFLFDRASCVSVSGRV